MKDAHVASWSLVDFVYDASHSAAFGGSAVALFFLVLDSIQGQPFRTPSILGSALFLGASPSSAVPVQMDMVAYYTIVHFLVFGLVGMLLSILVHEAELHARHPGEVLAAAVLLLEGAFLVSTHVLLPGVLEELGGVRVFVANVLAVAVMLAFLLQSHQPDLWQRLLGSSGS